MRSALFSGILTDRADKCKLKPGIHIVWARRRGSRQFRQMLNLHGQCEKIRAHISTCRQIDKTNGIILELMSL
jgi:hypothetical protein